MRAVARDSVDACPGAARPHHAADGELLRLRVPGGALEPAALRALAAASGDLADGGIGLTSRGNLQVRGVVAVDVPVLIDRLRVAKLLPDEAHDSHERVRNIIASPLSGRLPESLDDVDPLVRQLDLALCARPGLAHLPGRFLFALDDGSQDVAGERADLLVVALGNGQFAVRPSGAAAGARVPAGRVVDVVLALAEGFLAERTTQRSQAWRIAELPGAAQRLLSQLLVAGHQAEPRPAEPRPARAGACAPEPGLIEQGDGRFAVCAVAGLGLLDADQALALAAASDLSSAAPTAVLRITPWRRAVIRDLDLPAALAVRELLDAVGLIVAPGTAWSRVTACAGRPGCAKSLTDVQADARAFAATADPLGPAVHWAGCERGCGTPSGDVVQMIATPAGYRSQRLNAGVSR
jgi:precorrin-3B synthase